jgi:uncharacterized protein YuzE
MLTLAEALPAFVAEVEASISSEGRGELALQLAQAIIERCTYEPEDDAAYIYLIAPSNARPACASPPVAETLLFYSTHGYNVDLDHEGNLFGIELLDRPDVVRMLRVANAL